MTADKTADAIAALERQARAPIGFVAAGTGLAGSTPTTATQPVAANPDAIDVDLDDL
jgi:pre-mRNA-splicing factor SYF1